MKSADKDKNGYVTRAEALERLAEVEGELVQARARIAELDALVDGIQVQGCQGSCKNPEAAESTGSPACDDCAAKTARLVELEAVVKAGRSAPIPVTGHAAVVSRHIAEFERTGRVQHIQEAEALIRTLRHRATRG
jgi:hypothetical protein